MVRHGRSSITDSAHLTYYVPEKNSVPLTYFVPEMTALSIVSKHLDFLTKKKKLIDELIKMKKNKNLDMAERELLRSRPCVQNQIEVLEKLIEKFTPKSERDCLNPAHSLISSESTKSSALSFVAELLVELDQKRALISEIEECLCLGKSLLYSQQMALRCKSEVVHQMDVLERIFKEISLAQLPLTRPEPGREVADYDLPPLLLHLFEFRGFIDIFELEKRVVKESAGDCVRESARRCKAIRNLNFSPSMNEKVTREVINGVETEPPRHKHMYLCISNGFEIIRLDLKQSKDQTFSLADDVLPLPKTATLELPTDCLPVASVGLFKWRSNAYMICGKVLKSLLDEVHSSKPSFPCRTTGKWNYFRQMLYVGSSSYDIHRFSLAEDGTSSHTESVVAKLNKPKLWPTVENIDGQIHVFDSLPSRLCGLTEDWTFSHEVLNPDSGTWTEISSPIEDVLHIDSHLVVGDRIFAVSPMGLLFETHSAPSFLMYNSKTKAWKLCDRKRRTISVKDVWGILLLGHVARCAGRFTYGNPSEPLYVIIVLKRVNTELRDGMHASAYLVTSMGKIVCSQVLRDFFTGPLWPYKVLEAKLVRAEDDEGKATMCSVVIGTTWEENRGCAREYVFINTFSVEELTYGVSQVRKLLAKGKNAWPVVQDFVRVDIKDKCIYEMTGEFEGEADLTRWALMQACFI